MSSEEMSMVVEHLANYTTRAGKKIDSGFVCLSAVRSFAIRQDRLTKTICPPPPPSPPLAKTILTNSDDKSKEDATTIAETIN